MARFAVLLVAFVFCGSARGHSYSLGDCPVVEPQASFDMKKMLGVWYVVQKTSTGSTCITYNFTRTDEPDRYEIEQVSQHFALGLTPLRHEYHYTGRLTVPFPEVPARMTVKFPLSVAGKASYTVFMTDYDNYAGIHTCQKIGFAHRQSSTILSRERSLDKMYIDKIRSRLASFNVDPHDLSIIKQKDCPTPGGYNINIDDETFTKESAADAAKTVVKKIGDGVEFVANGAKTIYHKYADSGEDDESKSSPARSRLVTPNPDAEWLP